MEKVKQLFCMAELEDRVAGLGLFNLKTKTDADLEKTINGIQLPEGYISSTCAEFYAVPARTEGGSVSTIESDARYAKGLFVIVTGESPDFGKAAISHFFGNNGAYERVILASSKSKCSKIIEAGTYEERAGVKYPQLDENPRLPQHFRHQGQVDATMRYLVTGRSI